MKRRRRNNEKKNKTFPLLFCLRLYFYACHRHCSSHNQYNKSSGSSTTVIFFCVIFCTHKVEIVSFFCQIVFSKCLIFLAVKLASTWKMLTRSKAQEKDRKLVVENTTIELKPVSVCLHRDEIDKFYVSNDCKSEYYAVGVGVAQPTVLVDAVSGNFNNGDCDTIIQTSSGPFIQSECNGTGKCSVFP